MSIKPRITFSDGGVEGTLACQSDYVVASACRFANWMPMNYRPRGASAATLATEQHYVFTLRTDYGASFEIRGIGMSTEGPSGLDIAERLIAHLLNGGTCAVYPMDTPAASYTNCGLWPGTTPTLTQADRRFLDYTLSVTLINLSQTVMTCHYAAV